LCLGHSYVVGLNRRLPDALARAGAGRWQVTCAAPAFVHGDLRPVAVEPLPEEACRLVPVPAYLTAKPHLLLYGRVLRRLISQPWDVVHAWVEPYTLAGYQVARWAPPNAKLVYATFQNIPKRYPPPFRWTERAAMRRADGWIAFGESVRAALTDRPGYADKPHRVIPVGVDTDRFRPNPAAGAAVRAAAGLPDPGPPVVGYLGRFVPEKGLRLLTGALDRLTVPWRAVFVGSGPLAGELRAWAAHHPGRAAVLTGVPHEAVPAHLAAMDLLAAPSQTTPRWKEQLGRMLLEGFATGLAVVASDSGEIPHVVGDAGLVLPEADLSAWEATLTRLLTDPAIRADLAERGRKRALDRFDWPVVARQHLAFLDELPARSP
jgi:glycosyltransferase involved in cell wall biosynthesis